MPPDPTDPSSVPSVAQVFVADLDAPELSAEDAHHLQRVLRVRPGETVIASDGRGRWRPTRYRGGDLTLELDGAVISVPRPRPPVTVGFVAMKGDRPEWVVRQLTECGVDRIAVLRAARSVVRWEPDRAAKVVERLGRVSKEAAAQSRRPWLAEVVGVHSVSELVDLVDAAGEGSVALAQPGGPPPTLEVPSVAVGPEGGWDPAELAGMAQVGLGRGVRRAETAAVCAGILLCAQRDGIVGPAPGRIEGQQGQN